MLTAILSQIVLSDDIVLHHTYLELAAHSPLERPEIETLTKLTIAALQSQRACYIIIDGLDECGEPGGRTNTDAEEMLQFLRELLVLPTAPDQPTRGSLRLFLSGQRDGYWEAQLAKLPRIQPIRLDSENGHNQDIRNFCLQMTDQLLNVFQGPKVNAVVTNVIVTQRKVENRAKGGFTFPPQVL